MKKGYIALVALLFCVASASGQTRADGKMAFLKKFGYELGLHTGMDIGAAVPWPPSNLGSGMKMNAVPHLAPQLGVSGTARINPRWSLSVEATYKQLGIDAKARVDNQKFMDPNKPEDGSDALKVNFKGTTEISMRFYMLEVPLYAGFSLGRNDSRIVGGLYYSRIFKGKFEALPLKGAITRPGEDEIEVVNPGDLETQNFDSNMDTWDWGFMLGYEWRVIDRVQLGVRYAMGLKDIFRPGAQFLDYDMLHMRGSVVLSYKLFRFRR
ncbi:PorT family protein [Alistipes sp. OttesenSCG-928-B03]|nr:PorT family protein [Alistipes sp. OttesenSCG-928-B03]